MKKLFSRLRSYRYINNLRVLRNPIPFKFRPIIEGTLILVSLLTPILIFTYLDNNSVALGIQLPNDYFVPNSTLKVLLVYGAISLLIYLIWSLIAFGSFIYLLGLKLSFLEDITIFGKYVRVPLILFYFSMSAYAIALRRVPHYHELFDIFKTAGLVLSFIAFVWGMFNVFMLIGKVRGYGR